MQLMKLNAIYVELRGDSWFDSNASFNEELKTAMIHVMPDWLYDQAMHLIDELYELDKGNTENEECWFMIDMENFRSSMYEAHKEIMRKHNADTLAVLDVLDGDDEVEFDLDKWLSDDE